jgi:hypothetical protein
MITPPQKHNRSGPAVVRAPEAVALGLLRQDMNTMMHFLQQNRSRGIISIIFKYLSNPSRIRQLKI